MTKNSIAIYLAGISLLFSVVTIWYGIAFSKDTISKKFSGIRALADVETQISFGPRIPGSSGHVEIVEWMQTELASANWESRIQSTELLGHPIENIIAYRGGKQPQIIIGAHYDTRIFADNDPEPNRQSQPVPGANDGASGVAVLLELARVHPKDMVSVWLVFFDAEDNGRIDDWDWILGSKAFAAALDFRPKAVVIVDMIGDADLNIYKERTSDQNLTGEIWSVAAELGYEKFFIQEPKYSIMDDHTPFLEAGLPAVDIIDFDYPYWHTTQDTLDKVSAESLEIVGRTLQVWLEHRSNNP